jgi:hypothetical protein
MKFSKQFDRKPSKQWISFAIGIGFHWAENSPSKGIDVTLGFWQFTLVWGL